MDYLKQSRKSSKYKKWMYYMVGFDKQNFFDVISELTVIRG